MLVHRSVMLKLTRRETQHPPVRIPIRLRGLTHSDNVHGCAVVENPGAFLERGAIHPAGARPIRFCVHPEKPTNPFRPLTFAQSPCVLTRSNRLKKLCET